MNLLRFPFNINLTYCHVTLLKFPRKQKKHNEYPIHCFPSNSVRALRTDVFNYTVFLIFVNGITTKLVCLFLVIFHKELLSSFYSYLPA